MSVLSTRELDKLFSNQNLQSTEFILLVILSEKIFEFINFFQNQPLGGAPKAKRS